MELDIVLNALAVILFLGFGMASVIVFSTIDKQKDITVFSRYGRNTEPLDILYVNIGFVVVALMFIFHSYRFLPALLVFLLWIILNSRTQSGIAPEGVFIGSAFIGWDDMTAYRIINDEISTIKVLIYSKGKCYVLRCDKDKRKEVEDYFIRNGTEKKDRHEGE